MIIVMLYRYIQTNDSIFFTSVWTKWDSDGGLIWNGVYLREVYLDSGALLDNI